MNDYDKSSLFHIMQNVVSSVSSDKFIIDTFCSYFNIDGTSGIKFIAKNKYTTIPFFIGFTNDSKNSGSLVFGI